jgi:hypothetical protein
MTKAHKKLLSEWLTAFGYGTVVSLVAQLWDGKETNPFLFFGTLVFGFLCYGLSWYIVPQE